MPQPAAWQEWVREWAGAVARLPELLCTLALRRRSLEEELVEASLRGKLRKALSRLDLLCLVGGPCWPMPCIHVDARRLGLGCSCQPIVECGRQVEVGWAVAGMHTLTQKGRLGGGNHSTRHIPAGGAPAPPVRTGLEPGTALHDAPHPVLHAPCRGWARP